MTSLFLTILCSTLIALILKYNDVRGGNPLLLLAGNYFVAALFGLVLIFTDKSAILSAEAVIFGLLLAGMFVFSFFAFTRAVNVAGTALATVSSRLSVAVPLILSIIVFSELPSIYQSIGFLFTFLTIGLFYYSLKKSDIGKLHLKDAIYLILVLLGIGISDFCLKIFQQWRPFAEKSYFIFFIFFASFIYSSILVIRKKIPLDKQVLARGAILGLPNVLSTIFLLSALSQLPAIFVYPAANIGIILFTSFGAKMFWQEQLNKTGYWALVSGVIAVILLGN